MTSLSERLFTAGRSLFIRVPDMALAGLGLQRRRARVGGALGWIGVGAVLGASAAYLAVPANRAQLRSLAVRLGRALRGAPAKLRTLNTTKPAGSNHQPEQPSQTGGD